MRQHTLVRGAHAWQLKWLRLQQGNRHFTGWFVFYYFLLMYNIKIPQQIKCLIDYFSPWSPEISCLRSIKSCLCLKINHRCFFFVVVGQSRSGWKIRVSQYFSLVTISVCLSGLNRISFDRTRDLISLPSSSRMTNAVQSLTEAVRYPQLCLIKSIPPEPREQLSTCLINMQMNQQIPPGEMKSYWLLCYADTHCSRGVQPIAQLDTCLYVASSRDLHLH